MPTTPDGVALVVGVSPIQPTKPKTDPVSKSASPPPSPPPKAPPKAPPKPPPKAEDDTIDLMAALAPSAPGSSKPPASKPSAFSPPPDEPAEEQGEFELNLDNTPAAPTRRLETAEAPAAHSTGKSSSARPAAARFSEPEPPPGQGVQCPSCEKRYKAGSKICVVCGIEMDSGRSLLVSNPGNLNQIYMNAQSIVMIVSWIIWAGFYPFATETHGGFKKYATWFIASMTLVFSLWFYTLNLTGSTEMHELKNYMLWAGHQPTTPKEAEGAFNATADSEYWGDSSAYEHAIDDLSRKKRNEARAAKEAAEHKVLATQPDGARKIAEAKKKKEEARAARAAKIAAAKKAAAESGDEEAEEDAAAMAEDESDEEEAAPTGNMDLAELERQMDKEDKDREAIAVEAYQGLSPQQRPLGEFSASQLLTYPYVHVEFLDLVRNMLLLLVFGLAINGLIGNMAMLVVYPTLAIAAGMTHCFFNGDHLAAPMVGARGAVLGLAGMYLVLFPIHKVHVVSYWRRGIFHGFHLHLSLFESKGFWIVLALLGIDVLISVILKDTGLAYMGQYGGFATGMAFGLILIVTRAVNTRGGDLLSVVLGKNAWPLIGKPSQWAQKGRDYGWLQAVRLWKPSSES